MPPTKICPYCDYTTGSTNCLNPHVFKNHKDVLLAALTAKYSQYKIPIAPFTVAVPKYSKEWIVCLCCNEIWTSRGPYDKHIVSSKGACVPANQLVALQTTTGLKFSDKAMEQTATTALQKQHAEAIEKLQAHITKIEATLYEVYKYKIQNLENRVFKIGCCRCTGNSTAPAQNTILPPPPQPTPQPPPKPTIKPAPPVVYDDDEDDEEEYSSKEEPVEISLKQKPVEISLKLRCKYAERCGEIGDVNAETPNHIYNCLKCKVPICRPCLLLTPSTQLKPYCSIRCKPPKIEANN